MRLASNKHGKGSKGIEQTWCNSYISIFLKIQVFEIIHLVMCTLKYMGLFYKNCKSEYYKVNLYNKYACK